MSASVRIQDNKIEHLRIDAMRGNWSKVFKTYKQERALRTAKITGTGDTVLHMAVSSGKEHVVANMVDLLVREENARSQNNVVVTVDGDGEQSWNVNIVLGADNDIQNTPLHLAASMGNVEMCKKIGGARPFLIARRNIAGETPLFLAVLYGKKKTFLWLHHQYMSQNLVSSTILAHCVRDTGDTILHCAIAEGHFDVAIKIVHLYKDHLKEMVKPNKEGFSPLHLLAAKPSAFKSRTWWLSNMKQKRTWSIEIMNELLNHASDEDMSQKISRNISEQLSIALPPEKHNETESGKVTIETPLLIAAKNGVTEIVERILELFPSRIKDMNAEGKNILLLAVEYRRKEVVLFLSKQKWISESLFRQVDKDGNNALHLAARLELKPGKAPSMSREILWYEFVKNSMPHGLLGRYNRKMEIPDDIFRECHEKLLKSEVKWATKTSQACSVVTTLVASASFATRTNVPGGCDGKGYPNLINKPRSAVFPTFEYFSLGAFLFSLISTICFLSIAASRSQSIHSWRYVPFKLYCGMYFMFSSIVCLWISFCAADFFMLREYEKSLLKTLLIYIEMSLLIIIFVVAQLRTFFGPALSGVGLILVRSHKATIPLSTEGSRTTITVQI